MEAGLIAMAIEVLSITASPQQLKKPITGLAKQFINADVTKQRPATQEETDAAFKKGIGVLASTARKVTP